MIVPLMVALDFMNFTYATNPCAANVPVPVVMRHGAFSYFDPKMGAGYYNRGRVLTKRGDYPAAIADFEKAINNRIKFSAQLIGTPEGGNGALLDAPILVSKGLNELDVATWAGGGNLDIHAPTLSGIFDKENTN